VIGGTTRCCRACTIEAQRHEIQLVDEDINDSDRVVCVNEVVQALGQQRDLVPILSLDESLHAAAQSGVHII
jgi:hypothetical protein